MFNNKLPPGSDTPRPGAPLRRPSPPQAPPSGPPSPGPPPAPSAPTAYKTFPGTRIIAGGWLAFAASHFLLSTPTIKKYIMTRFGFDDEGYQRFYGTLSLAISAPLAAFYFSRARGRGLLVHDLAKHDWAFGLSRTFSLASVFFFSQSISRPLPMTDTTEAPKSIKVPKKDVAFLIDTKTDAEFIEIDLPATEAEVLGITKITRHPMLCGFIFLGLGQMLRRGTINDLCFWAPFPVFSLFAGWHQDYRHRSQGLHGIQFWEQTSFLPFKRIYEGKHQLGPMLYELSPLTLAGLWIISAGFTRLMNARRNAHEQVQSTLRQLMRDEVKAYRESGGEAPYMPRTGPPNQPPTQPPM